MVAGDPAVSTCRVTYRLAPLRPNQNTCAVAFEPADIAAVVLNDIATYVPMSETDTSDIVELWQVGHVIALDTICTDTGDADCPVSKYTDGDETFTTTDVPCGADALNVIDTSASLSMTSCLCSCVAYTSPLAETDEIMFLVAVPVDVVKSARLTTLPGSIPPPDAAVEARLPTFFHVAKATSFMTRAPLDGAPS